MMVAEWMEKLSKLDPTQRIFVYDDRNNDRWEPDDIVHCSAEIYDTDAKKYVKVKGYEIQ